jgi:hypothetical protein
VLSSARLEDPVVSTEHPDGRSGASWPLVVYLLAAGVFLLLVPWTRAWTWNPLLRSMGGLESIGLSPLLRGAISGLGAYLLLLGLLDLPRGRRSSQRR